MVASRRSSRSSTVDYRAQGKRSREQKSSVSEPAPKRQRTQNNQLKIFDFPSASDVEDDDEENDDPQSPDKRRSSARLSTKATPEVKKNGTGRKVSVSVVIDAPAKSTNGKRRSTRGRSPSPAVSIASSDELTSARTPLTPSRRYAQPHSIPKSGKKVSNLTKKLSEVTDTKVQKTHLKVKVEEETIPVSTTRSRTSRSVEAPPPAEFERIKHHVLSKLCGRTPIPLTGKAATISKDIHEIMARAIDGESNSLLLLGGPGSGKSAIVTEALANLKAEHPDPGKFYTIRLDGQVQLDDKIALREIARQLAVEMNIEMERMSFADTLTTFLYTLSHPSELSEEGGEKKTSACVIFILDSFDEFLSHPRQALLYNLFDIAQSRKAPIAVICLGRQVNAIDGLEKRVKSRFGGRIKQVSRPTELEEFWKVCEAALSVDDAASTFAKEWNAHIQGLWEKNVMKDICEEIFVESRDVREFFNKSIPIISSLCLSNPLPPAKAWTSSIMPPESKLSLVDGLSQLELGLLISATRLETFHALETFNFNMVYEIYTSLISRARTQLSASVTALGVQTVIPGGAVQLWGRDVAFRAWERLGEIGLWQYSGRGEGRGRFVRCEIDLIELSAYCDKKKVLHSAMKSWFKDGI